jgi:uncharacterized protein YndB with AHSA1/START domain
MGTTTDRIEKRVVLAAPAARVWRAVTDSGEFGAWFGARIEDPFRAGHTVHAWVTTPGYEHLEFDMHVESVEPTRRFAFRWCPHVLDADVDPRNEPTTLVEFELEPAADGTLLTVRETGWEAIPEWVRAESFGRNERGWGEQMDNVARHVAGMV